MNPADAHFELPERAITNTLAEPGMWDDLERQAGEHGHAITQPAPRALVDEIGSQNPERAAFLLRYPGIGVAVNDLVLSVQTFARRTSARPADLQLEGAQMTANGVFSCLIRRT